MGKNKPWLLTSQKARWAQSLQYLRYKTSPCGQYLDSWYNAHTKNAPLKGPKPKKVREEGKRKERKRKQQRSRKHLYLDNQEKNNPSRYNLTSITTGFRLSSIVVKLQSDVQTSVFGLGVDFVLPLSQQQDQKEQEEEEEPPLKSFRRGKILL